MPGCLCIASARYGRPHMPLVRGQSARPARLVVGAVSCVDMHTGPGREWGRVALPACVMVNAWMRTCGIPTIGWA